MEQVNQRSTVQQLDSAADDKMESLLLKVKKQLVDMLKVKETEKLTFVHQTVYNTDRVDFFGKVEQAGSVSASFQKVLNLNVKMDSLNEDTQTKLPESLPPPLQEDGELRWVVETLEQLSDRWDQPEFPPGVMLEVLSLAVRGLSLMQTKTDS
ncbi:hypothetical protein Q5P01_024089 [Channa striata]|uniref:Uncharacterized protein n=1 Tax=Channa striata TaxID=64152 RepID=A0AA88IKS3_CHASR|nr:hypothetical protein Q5P01_024089 [Channa striata]